MIVISPRYNNPPFLLAICRLDIVSCTLLLSDLTVLPVFGSGRVLIVLLPNWCQPLDVGIENLK